MTKYLVIDGNPVDGFTFTGPFDTHDEATKYRENDGGDWWVAPLHTVEEA